jgi:hypothetical protein
VSMVVGFLGSADVPAEVEGDIIVMTDVMGA